MSLTDEAHFTPERPMTTFLTALALTLAAASPAAAQDAPDVSFLPGGQGSIVCAIYGQQYDPATGACAPLELDLLSLTHEQAAEVCAAFGLWYDAIEGKCVPVTIVPPRPTIPEGAPVLPPRIGSVDIDPGEVYVTIDHNHRVRALPEEIDAAVELVLTADDALSAAIDAGYEVVE